MTEFQAERQLRKRREKAVAMEKRVKEKVEESQRKHRSPFESAGSVLLCLVGLLFLSVAFGVSAQAETTTERLEREREEARARLKAGCDTIPKKYRIKREEYGTLTEDSSLARPARSKYPIPVVLHRLPHENGGRLSLLRTLFSIIDQFTQNVVRIA